jgi:hypothetical protein
MSKPKKIPAYLTAEEIWRLFAVIESPRGSLHIPHELTTVGCGRANWT